MTSTTQTLPTGTQEGCWVELTAGRGRALVEQIPAHREYALVVVVDRLGRKGMLFHAFPQMIERVLP